MPRRRRGWRISPQGLVVHIIRRHLNPILDPCSICLCLWMSPSPWTMGTFPSTRCMRSSTHTAAGVPVPIPQQRTFVWIENLNEYYCSPFLQSQCTPMSAVVLCLMRLPISDVVSPSQGLTCCSVFFLFFGFKCGPQMQYQTAAFVRARSYFDSSAMRFPYGAASDAADISDDASVTSSNIG